MSAARPGVDGDLTAESLDPVAPPHELENGTGGARPSGGFGDDLEGDGPLGLANGDPRRRPAAGALEHLEAAEVHEARNFRREARARRHLDACPGAEARRCGTQRRSEAARFEQRGVDPVRELPRLLERVPYVASDLVEELPGRSGILVRQLARKLDVDRERDQVLLNTVVELALDPPAVGVGGQDEALSGCAELLDLEAQPVERLLRRLGMWKLQGDRLPVVSPARSCPSSRRRRQEAHHPLEREVSLPADHRAPP